MSEPITATQFRKRVPEIIDRAATGERVEVTRNGRTVAYVVPYSDYIRLANL